LFAPKDEYSADTYFLKWKKIELKSFWQLGIKES
jgi:hypothetical protein